MAVLGLHFCVWAFSSCSKWGPLFIAVCGPLTIAASLVVEHSLQTRRLSNCGSRAQLLRGMWDLPRPGLKPMSPALAGRFSTTAPPGKPHPYSFVSVFPFFFCLTQVGGEFLAFWEGLGLLPAFSRCSVGVVPHVDVFLMYLWGGRWSPHLTPSTSWREKATKNIFRFKYSELFGPVTLLTIFFSVGEGRVYFFPQISWHSARLLIHLICVSFMYSNHSCRSFKTLFRSVFSCFFLFLF